MNNQLFIASKASSIKKHRLKSKTVLPILYVVLATVLFFSGFFNLSIAFVVLAILWYLVYPKYLASKYIMHYDKYIEENFAHLMEEEMHLSFDEDYVFFKDSLTEGKMKMLQIKSITRIPENYLLNIEVGTNLILPLFDIHGDELAVIQFVKSLSEQTNLTIKDERLWSWK